MRQVCTTLSRCRFPAIVALVVLLAPTLAMSETAASNPASALRLIDSRFLAQDELVQKIDPSCPDGYDSVLPLKDHLIGRFNGAQGETYIDSQLYFHGDGSGAMEWCGIAFSNYHKDGLEVPDVLIQTIQWHVDDPNAEPPRNSQQQSPDTRVQQIDCSGYPLCMLTFSGVRFFEGERYRSASIRVSSRYKIDSVGYLQSASAQTDL